MPELDPSDTVSSNRQRDAMIASLSMNVFCFFFRIEAAHKVEINLGDHLLEGGELCKLFHYLRSRRVPGLSGTCQSDPSGVRCRGGTALFTTAVRCLKEK